jgi:hypothetical protein
MAMETPTRDKRWLNADELRKLTAAEPEAGPPPAPVHRSEEPRSRTWPAVGVAALLLVLVVAALVAL